MYSTSLAYALPIHKNVKIVFCHFNICAIFCNSLTQCVCIQYNGSAFNFYCYEVGRLSEIESVETCEKFHEAWLLVKIPCKMYKSGGLSTNNISFYRTTSPRHFRNSLLLTNFLLRESIGGMMIQLPLDAKSLR